MAYWTPARRAYLAFMRDQPAVPYSFDTGHPDDSRVLGYDEFLAALPEVDYSPRNSLSLDELATKICHEAGHSLDEVRSSSRRRQLTPIRLTIARRALDEGISSLTVIARYLGRDPSSLCKLLARHV